jgi:hypothetical protein
MYKASQSRQDFQLITSKSRKGEVNEASNGWCRPALPEPDYCDLHSLIACGLHVKAVYRMQKLEDEMGKGCSFNGRKWQQNKI